MGAFNILRIVYRLEGRSKETVSCLATEIKQRLADIAICVFKQGRVTKSGAHQISLKFRVLWGANAWPTTGP